MKTNNELIAEFMGNKMKFTFDNYQTSWDWIMPVVEKIENIKEEGRFLFRVDFGRDYCSIAFNDMAQNIIAVKSISNHKIQSIYLTVVEFIKWYNSQPKPND